MIAPYFKDCFLGRADIQRPALADHATLAIVMVAGDELAHCEVQLLDFYFDNLLRRITRLRAL